jgi:SAM-dependent methyltransferase
MLNAKVKSMEKAREFEFDYWDGDRSFGFGGYHYIPGRWSKMASDLIALYGLSSESKLLDVGCGKGFLLYELQKLLPGIQITGLDISNYAITNSHPKLIADLRVYDCRQELPFASKQFDLVISINTLHNFLLPEVVLALSEIQRVGKLAYVVDEAYETLQQFFNLQCWALTAPTLITPEEWRWLFRLASYEGDYEFIYFD